MEKSRVNRRAPDSHHHQANPGEALAKRQHQKQDSSKGYSLPQADHGLVRKLQGDESA